MAPPAQSGRNEWARRQRIGRLRNVARLRRCYAARTAQRAIPTLFGASQCFGVRGMRGGVCDDTSSCSPRRLHSWAVAPGFAKRLEGLAEHSLGHLPAETGVGDAHAVAKAGEFRANRLVALE